MNRNNFTISEKTKVTLTLVVAIIFALGGFGTIAYQAASALPRVEAYEKFVPKEQYERDMDNLNRKLDILLERLSKVDKH